MGDTSTVIISALIGGGVVSAFITGTFLLITTLINKKAKGPADEVASDASRLSKTTAAIQERNEIIDQLKRDREADRAEMGKLRDRLDAQDARINNLEAEVDRWRASHAAWLNWAYRMVAAFRKAGGADEDIPRPTPEGLNV